MKYRKHIQELVEFKNNNTINEPSILEFSYKNKSSIKQKINQSSQIHDFIRQYFCQNTIELHETFVIVFINRSNNIIGGHILSQGGKAGTEVDVSQVVAKACITNSSSIILAHNHPSGNLKPSSSDIKITENIKQALRLCEISILDHIILTSSEYLSFADEGIL